MVFGLRLYVRLQCFHKGRIIGHGDACETQLGLYKSIN
jgi:hypothetical protein